MVIIKGHSWDRGPGLKDSRSRYKGLRVRVRWTEVGGKHTKDSGCTASSAGLEGSGRFGYKTI